MITRLANVALLVKDYDEAIQWYTTKLGLELRMDGPVDGSGGGDYRFVTVGLKGQDDVSIVLHKPFDGYPEARSNVHGLLFQCEDCRREAEQMKARDVRFTREPEDQPWGVQAVFEDLYGTSHVLLEPSAMAQA